MADTPVTYALRQAALATIMEQKVAPQINRSSILLQLLSAVPADGKNITWDVSTGTAVPTTAAIADGVAVTNFNSDTKQPAVLTYTTYHDAFAVTGLAEATAAAAGNPLQLANLVEDEMRDALTRLGAAIGSDLYVGTGANDKMMGLVDATSGGIISTGTYAGISRDTYPQWAGNEVAAGNQRITRAMVRELKRKINKASGQYPSFYVTTPESFDIFAETLQQQRRFVQDVNLSGRGPIKLDGGFEMVDFDGIPVFSDVRCPAGYFLALNSNEQRIRYVPFKSAYDILTTAGIKVSPEMRLKSDSTPLIGKIKRLPFAGDKEQLGIFCYLNVQSRTPNTAGCISGLLET